MNNPLDSARKRKVLQPRPRPYRYKIKTRHYIGYRRNQAFGNGKWLAILYKTQHALGAESDMTYEDALDAAMLWFTSCEGESGEIVANATVRIAVDDYVQHLRIERSEQASRETGNRLRNHVPANMMKTKLQALTTRQIKQFRDGMVKVSDDPDVTRRSKDSANRVLGMLKASLNLAYKSGMVSTDVAWRRVDKFKNVAKARTLFLTDDQVGGLLRATTGGLHDLLEVAANTGGRYGELCNVRVSAFDAGDGSLLLDGKTGARTVYLSDHAVKVLKRISRDRLPSAYLLVQDGGNAWIKGSARVGLRKAIQVAKLPAETVFYSLRHYSISKALLAGVNAQVVAENCGTSVAMIEKHYGKFMKSDRRAMFNMVEIGS